MITNISPALFTVLSAKGFNDLEDTPSARLEWSVMSKGLRNAKVGDRIALVSFRYRGAVAWMGEVLKIGKRDVTIGALINGYNEKIRINPNTLKIAKGNHMSFDDYSVCNLDDDAVCQAVAYTVFARLVGIEKDRREYAALKVIKSQNWRELSIEQLEAIVGIINQSA